MPVLNLDTGEYEDEVTTSQQLPQQPPQSQPAQEVQESKGVLDLDTGEYVTEQPQVQQEQKSSLMDDVFGGVEGFLALTSGMLAQPIAGLAGLAASPQGFLEGKEGAGANTVKEWADAMTYKPRGEEGKQAIQNIGDFVKPATDKLEKFKKFLGDDAFNAFGSEELATLMYTIPDAAIEILTAGIGGRGTAMAKQAERLSKADKAGMFKKAEDATQPQVFKEEGAPASFKEEGVTATRGDATQDFTQQKTEGQLFEEAGEVGDLMRGERLKQSEQIKGRIEGLVDESGVSIQQRLDGLVDDLGVSEELGNSVKASLRSQKKQLKADRKNIYDRLSKESASVNLPVNTTELKRSLPDEGTRRDLAFGLPSQSKALQGVMEEFGVIGNNAAEVLSIGNFERFRKRLNAIERMDQSGQIKLATGPLKRALDSEITIITDSLIKHGGPKISQMAKDARKSHIALMTEFDPKAMTSKLIDNKRNSNVANTENSQVYQSLTSKSTSIEQYNQVIDSLNKSGNSGKKAIADLKNRLILDVIDSAYGAGTRKIKGQRTFGSAAYKKAIDNLRPKMEKVFGKAEMTRIDNIYDIAERIQTPSGAVPKGSAGFFIDVMKKAGVATLASKVPVVGPIAVEKLSELSKRAKSRKALKKALTLPKYKQIVETMRSDYPNLAAVLGIAEAEKLGNEKPKLDFTIHGGGKKQ